MKLQLTLQNIFIIGLCTLWSSASHTMLTTAASKASNMAQTAGPALGVAGSQLLNSMSGQPSAQATYNPHIKNYKQQQNPVALNQFKPTQIQQRSFSTARDFDSADWDAPRTHNEIVFFLNNQFADQFDQDANIAKIAWPMQGYSYQKIIDVMREAKNNAGTKKINMNSFYNALTNSIYGPKKPTTTPLANNKGVMVKTPDKAVAYHEAGHAVAELYNSTGYIVPMATAENYKVLEGFVTRISGHAQQPIQKHVINSMIMWLAGIVTEQVFGLGYPTKMLTDTNEILTFLSADSASGDTESFMKSAMQLLDQQNNLSQQQLKNLTVQMYQITYKFISAHTSEIQQLAESMMKNGTIYEDEIYSIPGAYKPLYTFEHGPLPEKLADHYFYRGQPNPYGYDEKGNYVGQDGYRDKNGNLQEID